MGKISGICLHNARALRDALNFCAANGIGSFRVNSQILPAKTHPEAGYAIEDVPDVHHHRCNPDGLTVEAATQLAVATWSREPLFRLSSPIEGWDGPKPSRHHDYIDADDFPTCWGKLDITVEVEAKAKELAILKLRRDLDDGT